MISPSDSFLHSQIITDARDTNGDWLYAFRLLGGKLSPVEWKRKYHFMIRHSKENDADNVTLEESLTRARERVYVHNRTIFKSFSNLTCYDTVS